MDVLRAWLKRQLSDPQVVFLGGVIIGLLLFIIFFGGILTPVLAGIILAYLLEGPLARLERWGISRWLAATMVWLTFIAGVLLVCFAVIPLLLHQFTQVIQDIPHLVMKLQSYLDSLPQRYPGWVSSAQIQHLTEFAVKDMTPLRQAILSRSLTFGISLLYVAVYLILVPLLVFFFLKDKTRILHWLARFIPANKTLATQVWIEVNAQISNYVRGKCVEILVVWLASLGVFLLFGLHYAMLLSALVGISLVVPFVGAVVVTVPVALVAYAQWGMDLNVAYVLAAYFLIHALDANVLAPLLFSEVVDLHPTAIIVAILFFGGIWGFWGVFFAIPLATVVNAVIKAWPDRRHALVSTGPPTEPVTQNRPAGNVRRGPE